MAPPRLTVPRPDGFVAAPDAPVALPEGSPARRVERLELTSRDARLVAECFAARVPGWSAELRGPIEGRTVAMLAATAERRLGAGVRVDHDVLAGELTLRATDDGRPLGHGRTLLGFDGDEAHTCYVACVARDAAPCGGAVESSTLQGGTSAPPPGLLLASAEGVVAHPRAAAVGLVGLSMTLGVIAVLSRRRPRTRV